MRQRLHVRRVHRHHRVEEVSEVDALRFGGQLEGFAITIEGPGAFGGRQRDRLEVGRSDESFAYPTVREFVDEGRSVGTEGNHGDNGDDEARLETLEAGAVMDVLELHRAHETHRSEVRREPTRNV